MKTLNRQFRLASKQKTATSNTLVALLEQSFPGIRKCFDSPARKDDTQKWVDFAHTFWHADCVRKCSQNAFSERYRKWCKRHGYIFKQSNAVEVYELARSVITRVRTVIMQRSGTIWKRWTICRLWTWIPPALRNTSNHSTKKLAQRRVF